jgi:hypothetical protein
LVEVHDGERRGFIVDFPRFAVTGRIEGESVAPRVDGAEFPEERTPLPPVEGQAVQKDQGARSSLSPSRVPASRSKMVMALRFITERHQLSWPEPVINE